MRAEITGLEGLGLLPSALARLHGREMQVEVRLRAFEVTAAVVRRPPGERHAFLRGQGERWLSNLRLRFPGSRWVVASQARDIPMELTGQVRADEVLELASQPGVRHVHVRNVPGRRRERRPTRGLPWHCVRGLVAVQVEGQTKGMQTIEDRLVLVRAASPRDAERRLRRHWQDYAKPYLNPRGQVVRWKLEAITDVYGLLEDDLDPAGVEVYSQLGQRRLRAELVWRGPRR